MSLKKIALSTMMFFTAGFACANPSEVSFTISDPNLPTISFNLLLSPVPDNFYAGSNFEFNITNATVDGVATMLQGLDFFNASSGGGVNDYGANFFNVYGAQYYSGTEESPTFLLGTYTGQTNVDLYGNFIDANATVTISAVPQTQPDQQDDPLPEPGSLALTGAALLALFAVHRKYS